MPVLQKFTAQSRCNSAQTESENAQRGCEGIRKSGHGEEGVSNEPLNESPRTHSVSER